MKHLTRLFAVLLVPALSLAAGCETMKAHPIVTGGTIGTLTGAAAGAAIGGKKHRAQGALIGAAAGAAVGAGVGYGVGKWMDRQANKYEKVEGVEVEKTSAPAAAPADAGAAPAAAAKPHLTLRMSSELLFESDSSAIKQAGVAKIAEIAQILNEDPTASVIVKGYTSSEGQDRHNLTLSRDRAEVVRDQLIADRVAASRIQAVGLGESNPIADNATAEGRARNRRVEIEVIPGEGAQ
jgi:outer membrane protein OmpA-like peptidoglycan-associated protein